MSFDRLLLSDLDGVLCDSVADALGWVWSRFRVAIPLRGISEYAMERPISALLGEAGVEVDAAALAAELLASCWDNAAFYRAVRPHTDYWQALLSWVAAGHRVQFVTRRRPHLDHVTRGWLAAHGVLLDGAASGPLPGQPPLVMHADKLQLAALATQRYAHVVLVDDAKHHAEKVAAATSAEVLMPARPWNAAEPLAPGVMRLSDAALAERIVQLASAR